MENLLQQKYQDLDGLRGRALFRLLAIIFVVFILLGLLIGYINTSRLNSDEKTQETGTTAQAGSVQTYKGLVTFIGEFAYPQDKIEYLLTDLQGNDIILLRSTDEKLSIAEGLYVTVTGKLGKTRNGNEDVLQVLEVKINNDTN